MVDCLFDCDQCIHCNIMIFISSIIFLPMYVDIILFDIWLSVQILAVCIQIDTSIVVRFDTKKCTFIKISYHTFWGLKMPSGIIERTFLCEKLRENNLQRKVTHAMKQYSTHMCALRWSVHQCCRISTPRSVCSDAERTLSVTCWRKRQLRLHLIPE